MPSAFTLFGEIKADTSGFNRSIREVESSLKAAQSEISKTERQAQNLGKMTATTGRAFEKMNERVEQSKKRLADTVNAFNKGEVSGKKLNTVLHQTQNALNGVSNRAKDVSARMTDAANRGSSFTTKMAGAFSASMLAVGALSRLGSALSDGAGAVLRYSANLEQTRIGLAQVAGGAQNANRILSDLQKFAINSPFQFEGLPQIAQRLAGAGVEAAKIVPLMRDIGNVVAATGDTSIERVDGISTALTQMISKTKVSAEEMEQLAERGVPAWKILSEATGKSQQELRQLSKQGKVTADEMVAALQKIAQTKFGDAMEKQSKTFNGAMNAIKTLAVQAGANAFAPLFDEIKRLATEASASMKDTAGNTRQLGEDTGSVLRGMIVHWKDFLSVLRDAASEIPIIGKALKSLGEGVSTERGFFASGFLGEMLYRTGREAENADAKVRKLADGLNGLTVSGHKAGQSLGNGITDGLTRSQQKITTGLNETFRQVQSTNNGKAVGLRIGGDIGDGLVLGMRSRLGQIQSTGAQLGRSAEIGLTGYVKSHSPSVLFKEIGVDIADGLVIGIDGKLDELKTSGAAMGKAIKEGFKSMTESLKQSLVSLAMIETDFSKWFGLTKATQLAEKMRDGFADAAKRAIELGVNIKNLAQLKAFKETMELLDRIGAFQNKIGDLQNKAPEIGGVRTPNPQDETGGLLVNGNQPGGPNEFENAAVRTKKAWEDFYETFFARLNQMRTELPSINTVIGETFIGQISQIGDVFANAISQWDGTAQGFFRSLAQGFAQMARQIIAELVRIAIMKAVLQLTGLFAGGAGAGGGTATLAHEGAHIGFAKGGFTGLGGKFDVAGLVHKNEFVMPMESVKYWGRSFMESVKAMTPGMMPAYAGGGGGTVYNNSTRSNTFNITTPGGGQADPRTRAQITNEIIKAMRMEEKRNK